MSSPTTPPMIAGFFPLACLLAAAMLWPAPAQSQAPINRCVAPDGVALYTDRRCGDVDAKPNPAQAGTGGNERFYRGGCARNVQDLVYEMSSAIDSGDVNRLAGVYHWAGMSGRAGYAVMEQLGALVERPLIEIVPVMAAGPEGEDRWLYPQTTVDSLPVALRVEQTLADSGTPSRTVFGMQQHFGCYWIKS